MERTEKNKLKRKAKWNFIGGLIALAHVLPLIIIPLMIDFKAYLSGDALSELICGLISIIFVLVVVMISLFSISNRQELKLFKRKIELERERNRLHVQQFWNKITEGKYDEAKEIFNHKTLISPDSDLKDLSLGILLGILHKDGKLALKWDVNPMEKMNNILAVD